MSSSVILHNKSSFPHIWDLSSNHNPYKDLDLFSSDGTCLVVNKIMFALNSSYLAMFKEQDSLDRLTAVSVEVNAEDLAVVVDFVHYGAIPEKLSNDQMAAFVCLGFDLSGKKFSKGAKPPPVEAKAKPELPELGNDEVEELILEAKMEEDEEDDSGMNLEEMEEILAWESEENYDDQIDFDDEDEEYKMEDVIPKKVVKRKPRKKVVKVKDEKTEPNKEKSKYSACETRNAIKMLTPDNPEDCEPGICLVCRPKPGKQPMNHKHLPAHNEVMHGVESTTCDICGKVYKDKQSKNTHKNTAHADCCCEICGKVLSNQKNLDAHKISIHTNPEDWPYKCDQCPRAFVHNGKLNEHKKVHDTVKPYICDQCGKAHASQTRLSIHIKYVHKNIRYGDKKNRRDNVKNARPDGVKIRPYGARRVRGPDGELIEKNVEAFKHYDKLDITDSVNVKCKECSRTFKGPSAFQRASKHVIVKHCSESERPFLCKICGKRFITEHVLQYHVDVHENKRAHKCNYCDARFNFTGNRNAHERSVHLGIKKTGLVTKSRRKTGCFKAEDETPEMRKERWMKLVEMDNPENNMMQQQQENNGGQGQQHAGVI